MRTTKKIIISMFTGMAVLLLPAAASAHVVVKPNEVGVGAFQTFTTSVPNEKDVPVTALRLVIPSDIKSVTPSVKPGWQVTAKQSDGKTTEIVWDGGSIPAGMRDDFTFSAQAPAQETTLQWKAYQSYADGTVVSWDQAPGNNDDDEGGDSGPYSTTKVVDDLTPDTAASKSGSQTGAYVLSGAALAVAVVALLRKRK